MNYSQFQWYRNNIPIPGANDTFYTASKAGIYTLSAFSPYCGIKVSNEAEIGCSELYTLSNYTFSSGTYTFQNHNLVDINSWASGIYIFVFFQKDGKVVTEKFVKE